MRVEKVNFSLTRTIPLITLTGRDGDQYANLKPFTSVTIAFDPGEGPINGEITAKVKKLVEDAFDKAAGLAFDEMATFCKELKEYYTKKD